MSVPFVRTQLKCKLCLISQNLLEEFEESVSVHRGVIFIKSVIVLSFFLNLPQLVRLVRVFFPDKGVFS